MLVLTRGPKQEILIGDSIVVRVLEVRGDKVKVGIECDRSIPVHRREVYDQIHREKQATGTEADLLPVDGLRVPRPLSEMAEAALIATTKVEAAK